MAIVFYRKDQIVDYQEGNHIDGYYLNRYISLYDTVVCISMIFNLELSERRRNLSEITPSMFDNEENCPDIDENGDYRGERFYRCLVDKNCLSEELRLEYVAIYKELLGLIEKVCDENLILKEEYLERFKGYRIEEEIFEIADGWRSYSKLARIPKEELGQEQSLVFDFNYINRYTLEFVEKFEKYKLPEFQIVFC